MSIFNLLMINLLITISIYNLLYKLSHYKKFISHLELEVPDQVLSHIDRFARLQNLTIHFKSKSRFRSSTSLNSL